MRIFKTIDFSLQCLTFTVSIFYWRVPKDLLDVVSVFQIVGMIQFTSWFIHLFLPENNWELLNTRKYYANALLIIMIAIVVGVFLTEYIKITAITLVIMLPIMAILYFYITLKELKNIRKQVN